MDAGTLIDLDVTGVAHGGVFVGRHEGRVVFVPDAIPGERVRVRLTETGKASFWRGDVVEVLEASPHRRAHIWRQADVDVAPEDRPGGADFGHIALAHQRELKLQVVEDALQRIGGLDLPVSISAATPLHADAADDDTEGGAGWRTRLSLHVDAEGRVGPYAARSHRVIPVTDHPLATAAIERVALELRGGQVGRVDLVQPSDGRVRVIERPETTRAPRGRRGGPGAARGGAARTTASAGKPARRDPAHEVVVETVDGRDFFVDAGGFWQVHRLAAHSLTRLVADSIRGASDGASAGAVIDPDAWHLDLYGGVGLFAATLGDLGGPTTRVTSVESDSRATDHAGENLAEWIGARAETGRVDRWLTQFAQDASPRDRDRLARGVVVLDPPRSGAGAAVTTAIADLAPRTVVYVACDPVALARDLATFRDAGYEASHIAALDLFPHSHHVEAVATLTRRAPRR